MAKNGTEVKERAEGEVPLVNVFIHGLVYDPRDGTIKDVGVSVGPKDVAIPELGLARIGGPSSNSASKDESKDGSSKDGAAVPIDLNNSASAAGGHDQPTEDRREACAQLCKAKRAIFGSLL